VRSVVENEAVDHRRATADRNVNAVLDAVEGLLGRREAVTVTSVANAAGVSRVTVYAHFANREDFLRAAMERAVERSAGALERARPDEGPPVAALERLIAAGWRELDRNDAVARSTAEHLDPVSVRAYHDRALRPVRALIDRGRADGSFRTDLSADWMVAAFFSLLHTGGEEARAGRLDKDSVESTLTTSILALFSTDYNQGT
jgi:AcrR family transcriptional regulator